MTIYADVLLLINFIMDSFILWIISAIMRKKNRPLRILAGGLAMALLFCATVYVVPFRFVNAAFASVLILSFGVALALRPAGIKNFFKMLAVGYGVSFAVGGLGLALFYLTDLPYVVSRLDNPAGVASGISWKLCLVIVVASYIFIKLALRVYARITLKRQELCPVRVFMGPDEVEFEALVDTGHSLREPISQSPVIVAEFEYIKTFLPDGLKLLFYEKQENNLPTFLSNLPPDPPAGFFKRVRMIPFSSLGRQNGMLIGFRPDRVAVGVGKQEYSDVVIGIYNSRLTRDGRYQGLLGPELMAG